MRLASKMFNESMQPTRRTTIESQTRCDFGHPIRCHLASAAAVGDLVR